MVRIGGLENEFVLGAMATAISLGGVANHITVVETDVRAILFGTASPASEADHLVVFGPLREGVVGGMHDDQAAAVFNIIHKVLLGFHGPWGAVVVGNNQCVVGEFRTEIFGVLWTTGGDINLKKISFFKAFLEDWSSPFPIVGVLAVEDEGL